MVFYPLFAIRVTLVQAAWANEPEWYRIFSALLNSFYSYYWDITKDWDLTLFSSTERHNPNYPFGLRRNRFFYAKEIYYTAMIIDFFLRFTWVIKLSPRLDRINEFESGIFLLMFLEVVRRWMWIFLRVETEWGKLLSPLLSILCLPLSAPAPAYNLILSPSLTPQVRSTPEQMKREQTHEFLLTTHGINAVRNNKGPNQDDILLSEFNGKIDED
jgi:hypothetical protein